tara:strand:- start:1043 stop:1453 length:411 start_codon:yes stop_codon:yes gene_type:complete
LTKVLQFAILSAELKFGFFILKKRIGRVVMRNFIFIAVFVAVLAVGTVCAEDSKQTEKAVETISLEEFQTQHEEIMSMISSGVVSSEELEKILKEDLELVKEFDGLQNARIEKMLRETKEGREEYRKAIEKYFSSD